MSWKNDIYYMLILIAMAIALGIANNLSLPDQGYVDSSQRLPWVGSPVTPDQVKEYKP